MYYILIILIASFMKAIADILASGNEVNVFKGFKSTYFRPTKISWKRKRNFKTAFLRFLFSTILVAFTDAWHGAILIMLLCFFGFLIMPVLTLLEVGFSFALFLVLFEGFYRVLKTNNGFNSTDLLVLAFFFTIVGAFGLNNIIYDEDITWMISLGSGIIALISIGIYGIIQMFLNFKEYDDEE